MGTVQGRPRDEDKYFDIIDGQIEAGELQNTLRESEISNFGYENYSSPRAKVVSSRPNPVKREREEEDDKIPQLPLELRNLVEEEEGDEPATARPTATVKIGNIPSRKEENSFDPMASPRPRGRPRKEIYS